jgi:predicted small secreted protein
MKNMKKFIPVLIALLALAMVGGSEFTWIGW